MVHILYIKGGFDMSEKRMEISDLAADLRDDRELLEWAAKAAGIKIEYWTEDSSGRVPVAVLSDGDFWQPLLLNTHTDCMGDALRLAVQLKLNVTFTDAAGPSVSVGQRMGSFVHESLPIKRFDEQQESDTAAACRAIVRAAAEVGKRESIYAENKALAAKLRVRSENL
jgi:hypothetical protein